VDLESGDLNLPKAQLEGSNYKKGIKVMSGKFVKHDYVSVYNLKR